MHGTHHAAQKLTTTTFPRNEESWSEPSPSSRSRSKSTGRVFCPFSKLLATFVLSSCTTFQTSSPSSATTSATAPIWPTTFSRNIYAATMKTVVPTLTVLNSHSASAMYMRMQPCETE